MPNTASSPNTAKLLLLPRFAPPSLKPATKFYNPMLKVGAFMLSAPQQSGPRPLRVGAGNNPSVPQTTMDSAVYDVAEILGMIRYELAKLNIRQAELIEVLEQAYNGGWG